jgi:hypothetical protein
MAKVLQQRYNDFRGVDKYSSELTRPENFAKEFKNYEINPNFSLSGRRGMKTVTGEPPDYSYNLGAGAITKPDCFAKIHTYRYKNPDTGATEEELIALGRHLYRYKEENFTITMSGGVGDTFDYSFLLNETSGGFEFKMYKNGILGLNTIQCLSGLEDPSTSSPFLLSELKTAIDAISLLSATCPSTISNTLATAIPLKALGTTPTSWPATISIPIGYWEEIPSTIKLSGTKGSVTEEIGHFHHYFEQWTSGDVALPVLINKDNLCYISTGGIQPLMVYDGKIVKRAGMPMLLKEDHTVTASGVGVLTGTYQYYVRLVGVDRFGNFTYGRGFYSDVINPSSNQVVFDIAATSSVNNYSLTDLSEETADKNSKGIYLGLSDGTTITMRNPSALESYFEASLRQGLFLSYDSTTLSSYNRISSIGATGAITTTPSTFPGAANEVYLSYSDFDLRSAKITTPYASATYSIGVATADAAKWKVGEWVFSKELGEQKILDNSGGYLLTDKVGVYASGDFVSSFAYEIYRTKNNGTDFYRVTTIAGAVLDDTTYSDNTPDSSLTELFIPPDREPDYLRENPSAIAQHQGLLVAAGFNFSPNKVFFEDAVEYSAFPLSTNYFDINSNEVGNITALFSDAYDQLAIFKPRGFYSVIGDLANSAISSVTAFESDIGVSSQSSILKVKGINMGIGDLGIIAFQNGEVSDEVTKQLLPDFLSPNYNTNYLAPIIYPSRSIAFNDSLYKRAIFIVPSTSYLSNYNPLFYGDDYSGKVYVFDYSEKAWAEWSFGGTSYIAFRGNPLFPNAGMTYYRNGLYLVSTIYNETDGNFYSYTYKRHELSAVKESGQDANALYDYVDQHKAIEYDLQNSWVYGADPSTDKTFQQLKIYMLESADFIPFTLRVRTYRNWNTSAVVDDINLTFSTIADVEKIIKLKATKSRCMMFRFTVSARHTRPIITGYEYLTDENSTQERLK